MSKESEFAELAPAGYYIGLRVRFSSPTIEINALPREWVEHYTIHGYSSRDPFLKWTSRATGCARWSEIRLKDRLGVRKAAKDYGLRYGAVVSGLDVLRAERSFGFFARSDREYTDVELAALQTAMDDLTHTGDRIDRVTPAECAVLTQIRDGARLKEIAHELDISESAVKARLLSAKRKLGARTSVHAVSLATKAWLI